MAEQHSVGGRQCERVGRRLLPGEMLRLGHELARLHAAELRERAVRRLVAPDALRRRQHGIAAIAVLVVPVILIAMDDHLVADLPAPHLGADRPHDAGGVGTGDVIGVLVGVEGGNRDAEARPYPVVIDTSRHHLDEHLVLADAPGRHHFELHRSERRTVALLADHPGMHPGRHMAQRRDLADGIKVLVDRRGFQLDDCRHSQSPGLARAVASPSKHYASDHAALQ
jgi:hypothetical protein